MNSIITAPSDALHVQQIPELNNELPENCIFNKGKTGCGATTLAIENRISTLIAVPTVNLIKNKLPEHADLLGVYGGVTNQEIADYLKTHDRWKIMATYDAIPRVAEVAGAEIYAKALLLVDEYHRLLFDYSFRHRAVTGLLAEMPKFSRATYMSATPIEREFLLDELQTLPTTRIIWPNEPPMQVRLWHENSPLASVVNLCHNAVTHGVSYNLHFFVNSVDFIGRVLHHARLSPDEVKIVCSTSGTSEQINREKLGGDYSIGIPDKAVRKINFYTSTAFEGCDIYDKQGKIYVVSDGTARHHLLDVSTTIRQIAGRIRDTRYKEITHIFSTVRYAEGITYPQFKAATEKELDKAERFVKWYATADEDLRNQIYTNNKYINTDTMTIDRNRIKLELLNFRNYAEIYADSRNLITEYERNDNKITTAERHDIRLTKLEKNAKAKIPFKELFDRYAELKASDTNPFSTDVFALSLIERRNPLVKQAFEILGTERVRELKYNQTQIRRELIKCSADELAYKIVKRINADLPHGKAIPSKIIKERLQTIYDDLGVERRAKATDIAQWFDTAKGYKNIDGKNTECYTIIRGKLVARKKIAAE